MKLSRIILNAPFFLAPSVTFQTFSKPLPSIPTNLGLIFLLGAIWRIEGLEGDGVVNVRDLRQHLVDVISSHRMLSKTPSQPFLPSGIQQCWR